MDMLAITNLQKRFGDKSVLKGLDLSVPEHSVFGFIGKNGAGKTTTMKTILGLLKADGGEILVSGEKVVYGQTATNRHIGYLPDVPEFYPFMTAPEYLSFCGEITGMSRIEIKSRSNELLKLVGLGNEKHRIKGFSRGMKQRLGIAQALLNRPKLLICDEPTSALDPVGRKEILDILMAVREQTTVLFSTHILSDVERICTDVAFLNDGVVNIQGKLSDIKSQYRTEEYVLETGNEEELKLIKDMRRRNPEAGLVVFWVKLRQRGYTRTVTGLYRVLRRRGEMAVKPKNPKYIPKPYEQMIYPGQRVQIDVKFVPAACLVGAAAGKKFYQYTAIDEFSRYRYLEAFEENSTYSSTQFLIHMLNHFKKLGFSVECVQTDNGFEFTKRFGGSAPSNLSHCLRRASNSVA